MFKDEDIRKFMLYTIVTGVLIMLMACVMIVCVVPGNEESCRVPFITEIENNDIYVYSEAPEYNLLNDTDYQTIIYTNQGNIKIDLFEDEAPNTVNNYVFLASRGYYNDVLFHVVFPDILLQTGSRLSLDEDPSNDGLGGPGYTFEDEVNWDVLNLTDRQIENLTSAGYSSTSGLASKPIRQYSVAMANSGTGDTNGSQFFIVTAPSNSTLLFNLQGKYTVFGEVIDGFDTVLKINGVDLNEDNPDVPRPEKDIIIESIDIIQISKTSPTPTVTTSNDQTVRF